MRSLAIIGTGIAGLGCAYHLQRHYQITLYEKADYLGGHAHTVEVTEDSGTVPIDTGFMVYNEITYPNLTRLFGDLAVTTRPSDMSFSVQHLPSRLEFCGSSLNHLFGQRRNLLRPSFWRMLLQIKRFNMEALAALNDEHCQMLTLGEYVGARAYGEAFLRHYLLPMSCAVWSAPPDRMLEFPAQTLLRFFHNHGFLGLHTQHPWRTVAGGSRQYVARATHGLRESVHLRRAVVAVRRVGGRVQVIDANGCREHHDAVILACHADEALTLLADADDFERSTLGAFIYQANLAVLHTDEQIMPKTRRCWSSWNYRVDQDGNGGPSASTVYWMNRLQGLASPHNYFVSINGEQQLRSEMILQRIRYEHPLFDRAAVRAQGDLPALNARRTGVYFCGSYFGYGFHEDALNSSLALSRVLAEDAWHRNPASMTA